MPAFLYGNHIEATRLNRLCVLYVDRVITLTGNQGFVFLSGGGAYRYTVSACGIIRNVGDGYCQRIFADIYAILCLYEFSAAYDIYLVGACVCNPE